MKDVNALGAMMYICYQVKSESLRDNYAKDLLRQYLTKKGLLYKKDSPLFGHPTKKGFKVLALSHFLITKYYNQIKQFRKKEPIRLIDKAGNTQYV